MITQMTASDDCQQLHVDWEEGHTTTFAAAFLRQQARDAWSMRERLDTGDVAVAPGIRITGLFAVGSGGVNVHFSDGHQRAIYPFSYLQELSQQLDN